MGVTIRTAPLLGFALILIISIACTSAPDTTPTPSLVPSPDTEDISAIAEISEDTQQPEIAPVAPVFSVSTVDGENIRLEDLLGSVPVYLLFIPSTTDELDRSQLTRIQSQIDKFDEMNAEVVVVVSDLPTRVIDMRDELGLGFSLIADPLHVVASDWQVFDLDNDGESNPASFVFDALGGLAARLIAAEPEDRPSVEEVLYVIEESLSSGAA